MSIWMVLAGIAGGLDWHVFMAAAETTLTLFFMQHEAMFSPALQYAAPALRLAHDRLSGGQIKTAQKAPAPGAHPPLEAEEAA